MFYSFGLQVFVSCEQTLHGEKIITQTIRCHFVSDNDCSVLNNYEVRCRRRK